MVRVSGRVVRARERMALETHASVSHILHLSMSLAFQLTFLQPSDDYAGVSDSTVWSLIDRQCLTFLTGQVPGKS